MRATPTALTAFPNKTHGYLYLARAPATHPGSASLRFRICDETLSPDESFAKGRDLLWPKGNPWELNLLQLLTSSYAVHIREGLVDDGVISPEVLQQVDKFIEDCTPRARASFGTCPHIFSFRQPFSVSMGGQKTTNVAFVDLDARSVLRIQAQTFITKEPTDTVHMGTVCLDYNPQAYFVRDRIVLRVLEIPKELRGNTRVGEGDFVPFKYHRNAVLPFIALPWEALVRQSIPPKL
ncbi:hypothetical protein BDP27DRAFT_300107 [Rhodocollybia butyracea]|uniref:Uncharacterized protein n=1 Tax=Rhodocollybia butyracea TaxID=206335 RepID=A0A9P5Q2D6_9AGAR|nr:hypothetical protein BDP27DRAFT_300107 [Rhodocollybia butyracea]